jgi:hypothetical protein
MSENTGHEGRGAGQTSIGDVKRATHAAVGRFREGVVDRVKNAQEKAEEARELADGAKEKLEEAIGMVAAAGALGNEAEAELRSVQPVGDEVASTLTHTVGASRDPVLSGAGAAVDRYAEDLVSNETQYVTARYERDDIAAAYYPLITAMNAFAASLGLAAEELERDHELGSGLADSVDQQVDEL